MSAFDLLMMRQKVKQIGPWAGVRWMRNTGIPFGTAYFVLFNRQPRLTPGRSSHLNTK